MSADERKRTLRVVYRALAALDKLWEEAPVCDSSDVELDRVIAGPVLTAEQHLWEASECLMRLLEEGDES